MLMQMLERVAHATPDKAAVVQGEKRVSYLSLFEQSISLSTGLQQLGVGRGDCVAVLLPNCAEFVISLFACARLGAVLLPLNPHYTHQELKRFIFDGQPRVIITEGEREVLCKEIVVSGQLKSKVVVSGASNKDSLQLSELLDTTALADAVSGVAEDKVLYLYTSGSTSEYKRLCCTQQNLYYEALNFVETIGLTADDSILCTVPLYHSYGLGNGLLDAVYTGATLVLLEPELENGKIIDVPFSSRLPHILSLIEKENIRFLPAVPYQFLALAQSEECDAAALSGLKWCVSSGDVLPESTYDLFLERFGIAIRSLYGSTEAGSICINTQPTEDMVFGSLGEPLKNVEIEIRDAEGNCLPKAVDGAIWVKSPVIPPSGYDNRPELSEATFIDGFYDSGDMGQLDALGHLKITGRKQTFVDVSGYKVDIGEVEEVLRLHPDVKEAAALGVATEFSGNIIKAVVVAKSECTESDIQQFCREQLAQYKIPRVVEFIEALPRSPLGKVLKKELQTLPETILIPRLEESLRDLGQATQKQKHQLVSNQVHDQVVETLQRGDQKIAHSQSFQSLGFDSISSVELQSRLSLLTGLPLAITLLWNHPSIEALATVILEKLSVQQSTAEGNIQTLHIQQIKPAEIAIGDVLNNFEVDSDDWLDDDADDFFDRQVASTAGSR